MLNEYEIHQTVVKTDSRNSFIASKNGRKVLIEEFNNLDIANQCFTIASQIYSVVRDLEIQKFEFNDKMYIVYNLFNIKSLSGYLNSDLLITKKIDCVIHIIKTLENIHKNKYIFNNLTIENCFTYKQNSIFLVDFRYISNRNTGSKTLHNPHKINPLYISPEQTGKTNIPVTIQSDFYALGILMHKLFTNQFPFNAEDISELYSLHIAKKPQSPNIINKQLPENLSAIILKLLKKKSGTAL